MSTTPKVLDQATEECLQILQCIRQAMLVNEVEATTRSSLPQTVIASQVAEDMNRLIERYKDEDTSGARAVVVMADKCKIVVTIINPHERKIAAESLIKDCEVLITVVGDGFNLKPNE